MITATEASMLTDEHNNYSDPLDIIEKYIRWATERGQKYTTARLNNDTVNILQENGFQVEQYGNMKNEYFIKW